MAVDRIENWQKFSQHMERYIQENTLQKYSGDKTVDLMAITNNPIICVWNILKYSLRIWNGRMKPHDIEKITHYAEMFWSMQETPASTQVEG